MPQVLIVDDDESVRRLLELLLKTSGYDTATASGGVEGLERMHRQLPCLVLLDIKMPGMDGLPSTVRDAAGIAGQLREGGMIQGSQAGK